MKIFYPIQLFWISQAEAGSWWTSEKHPLVVPSFDLCKVGVGMRWLESIWKWIGKYLEMNNIGLEYFVYNNWIIKLTVFNKNYFQVNKGKIGAVLWLDQMPFFTLYFWIERLYYKMIKGSCFFAVYLRLWYLNSETCEENQFWTS